jgi:hypothetical protein
MNRQLLVDEFRILYFSKLFPSEPFPSPLSVPTDIHLGLSEILVRTVYLGFIKGEGIGEYQPGWQNGKHLNGIAWATNLEYRHCLYIFSDIHGGYSCLFTNVSAKAHGIGWLGHPRFSCIAVPDLWKTTSKLANMRLGIFIGRIGIYCWRLAFLQVIGQRSHSPLPLFSWICCLRFYQKLWPGWACIWLISLPISWPNNSLWVSYWDIDVVTQQFPYWFTVALRFDSPIPYLSLQRKDFDSFSIPEGILNNSHLHHLLHYDRGTRGFCLDGCYHLHNVLHAGVKILESRTTRLLLE